MSGLFVLYFRLFSITRNQCTMALKALTQTMCFDTHHKTKLIDLTKASYVKSLEAMRMVLRVFVAPE